MIKVKFTAPTLRCNYTESSQANPLRWVMLRQIAEDAYVNTTFEFKCKDYLNDFVINAHGVPEFEIYGMKSTAGETDKDGGFTILLRNVTIPLINNVNNVINKEFGPVWGVNLTFITDDQLDVQGLDKVPSVIVKISKEALVSTFRISLISLLIRQCNVDVTYESFDDLVRSRAFQETSYIEGPYLRVLLEKRYNFPEQEEYFWYSSPKYNSKTTEGYIDPSYYYHNAGYTGVLGSLLTSVFPNESIDDIYASCASEWEEDEEETEGEAW